MIRTRCHTVALLALGWACASTFAVAAEIPRGEHPTPLAVREHWANLNGTWEFRFDAKDQGNQDQWFQPDAKGFDQSIVVPFPWESELSGIHQPKDAPNIGWYRRTFQVPEGFPKGDRVWLRFGAVDHRADVWVNGKKVVEHEGGYTPFEADVTDALKSDGKNVVVVRAFDPTDPSLPVGKQVGWYTTTSGIWQTVWLESRPAAHIREFTVQTAIDPAEVTIKVAAEGLAASGEYTVAVRSEDATVKAGSAPLSLGKDGQAAGSGAANLQIPVREPKLWTPETPHLYDVVLELKDKGGKVIDSVKTYFGLRTIARGKYGDEPFERVLLNGKPIYLRGALDQSFNPKGIYTAPSDEFLKRDIELAKSVGTNFLRIHIKPDEPRRLYWADKLGMLIMEDMPNTWQQNPTARKAWEQTMREVVARDRNHPSIFAWVAFNETWGLGTPPEYKKDKDTQAWVKEMVALTRQLDPTRLIEDNSPCNYDHVAATDLNSWHFYIDDHERAWEHIDHVVAQSEPGSPFNHCPGEVMNTAPLINSEYGSVSAGGGDRDVSWGFRDLTTGLRKHNKIQGYIYTELSDIEWEHNGFFDYDRTPKSFGYDAFVPGMTVADLQGADFIGYDAPPVIVAKPGELIAVPLFVSHYSDLKDAPTLRWWIKGTDDNGEAVEIEPRDRAVEWVQYGVKEQKRLAFRLKTPFVGALALVLNDKGGRKIAANFVNLVVKAEAPAPRVERLGDHEVAVRFRPEDFSRSRWTGKAASPSDKAYGTGQGSIAYRLKLPEAVVKAKPQNVEIVIEAAAKANREKVDWPERTNAQDYPQTDTRKWPTTLEISMNGQRVVRLNLPDDPADARGVLSHLARIEHGSYGELLRITTPLPESAKADLAAGRPLILRFTVPGDAEHPGGFCLFGDKTGAYPVEPTLNFETEGVLPANLGVKADAPVTIDVASARQVSLLHAGDSNQGPPATWAYTTDDPGKGWAQPRFADKDWQRGKAGFGTPDTPSLQERTPWTTPKIWLRTSIDVPKLNPADIVTVHLFHDENVDVLVNGKPLLKGRGYITAYRDITLDDAQKALFKTGANTIAVSCAQTGGGQGVDVGLGLTREE
ncbi:MAG: sugar-binding domain-containing protein [Isosphaeraceae bacterium]